jgi:hypothetical protein
MTTNQDPIICRSLRELDALIDVHLFGVKVPKRRGIVHTPPRYTTYAGMESVVKDREDVGLFLTLGDLRYYGVDDGGHYEAGFRNAQGAFFGRWRNIPVAVCLAALASVGVQVELNMGEPL